MNVLKHPTPLRFCLALILLLAVAMPAKAAAEGAACELKIRGHSIARLTLVDKAGRSGVRFDKPGKSVRLAAGTYRVEKVELEGGYATDVRPGQGQDWFEVTSEGPNELVVGAPLYPTTTVTRYGGFLKLNYETLDGAGRGYGKGADSANRNPPPPKFSVYKDGEKIGSGSFEYG